MLNLFAVASEISGINEKAQSIGLYRRVGVCRILARMFQGIRAFGRRLDTSTAEPASGKGPLPRRFPSHDHGKRRSRKWLRRKHILTVREPYALSAIHLPGDINRLGAGLQ